MNFIERMRALLDDVQLYVWMTFALESIDEDGLFGDQAICIACNEANDGREVLDRVR